MNNDHLQIGEFLVGPGALPLQMANSEGTALPLLKRGPFGADLIRFAPGRGVPLHTHPGNHILIVTSGEGRLIFNGEEFALRAGVLYLVPGSVPHQIDALTELTLVSVADDHRHAGSSDRLELVP